MKKCISKKMMALVLTISIAFAATSCSSSDDNGNGDIGNYEKTPVTYMEGTFRGHSGKEEAEAIVQIVNDDQALITINNNGTGEKTTATVYVYGMIIVDGVDPTVLSVAGEIPSLAYNHKTKKLTIAGRQGGVTMTFTGNKI